MLDPAHAAHFLAAPGAAGAASEVEVVDDKTIKITQDMKNPSVTFVRGVMDAFVVPKHVWESVLPADFWDTLKAARGDGPEAEAARAIGGHRRRGRAGGNGDDGGCRVC